MAVYIDTSAMVKRYLNEATSETFDQFLGTREDDFIISPLTVTEFESVLNRRLRMGDIDKRYLQRCRDLFTQDLAAALWQVRPFEPMAFESATGLIRELNEPLATLDALHLASALAYGCQDIATSDKQLARAATAAGLVIHNFSA